MIKTTQFGPWSPLQRIFLLGFSVWYTQKCCLSYIQLAPVPPAIKSHAACSTLIYNSHQSALSKLKKLSLMAEIKWYYCGRAGLDWASGTWMQWRFWPPLLPAVTLPKQERQQNGDETLCQGSCPLLHLLLTPSISLRGLRTGPWISLTEFISFLTDPLVL